MMTATHTRWFPSLTALFLTWRFAFDYPSRLPTMSPPPQGWILGPRLTPFMRAGSKKCTLSKMHQAVVMQRGPA